MKFLPILVAPLALVLIGAAAEGESVRRANVGGQIAGRIAPLSPWQPPVWRQVHIEQHFSIRITPGNASMPRAIIAEIEEDSMERVEQRKIGKCLGINSIAAVRPGEGNQLLLFLRDQRVISATLEKRCSAVSFYSGFYVERNADGDICVGRDRLQSRSGANCMLRRFHELVPGRFRRFP